MKMKLNKIVALGILGLGVLGFGGNAVAEDEPYERGEIWKENQHIQHTGTDWYFEHRYGIPEKLDRESWLRHREEKHRTKFKEWLSQKISQEKLKQALKLTSPLNKNTSKTLSQDEIQALKIETQVLRQQFLNYIIYHNFGTYYDKLYQDKFRFIYNRSKDLIILMIDNKVKDKDLLGMTLEYRKTLEEYFLRQNNASKEDFVDYLTYTEKKKRNIDFESENYNYERDFAPIEEKINNRDDVKKFDRIEKAYKNLNIELQEYIDSLN
ncbi:hypothetical protein [Ursidibacter sp. B-7004-1]